MFGCPKDEIKWEKMRETKKEREELKDSRPKRNFINEEDYLVTMLVWGFYSQTPFTNDQKQKFQTLLQGESRKKTKKRTKSEKVKRATGTVNRGENLNKRRNEN